VHCFKHKRTRKILAKKGKEETKKIELNRKWLYKKQIERAQYKAAMTKKKKMRKLG
jgi:hypothetical protein